jgi:arylsulfatase A-like enzyme
VLECTHDYNHSAYYADADEKLHWEGYDAIAQTHDVCEYLKARHGQTKPFVMFLTWGPPHNPYNTAPEKYQAMYSPENIKLRPNVPPDSAAEAKKELAGYYAHCTALDDCIGEILQTLKDTGLEEDTIILFTADHGDMIHSHNEVRKQRPWEESVHTPMLLHWTKGLGMNGRAAEAMINTEDLMPTLLGLSGVEIPKSVEGHDFTSYLIKGEKDPSGGATVIACPSPFGEYTRLRGGREYRGVRTTQYTYVRDLKGSWLLFDNKADPYQMHNLVGTADNAALQKKMDDLLNQKLKEEHDDFRPGAEYIAKWGYKVDKNGTMPYKN